MDLVEASHTIQAITDAYRTGLKILTSEPESFLVFFPFKVTELSRVPG